MAQLDVMAGETQEQTVERLLPLAREAAYSMLESGVILRRDIYSEERFDRFNQIESLLTASGVSADEIWIAKYIVVQILLGKESKQYQLPAEDKYSMYYVSPNRF